MVANIYVLNSNYTKAKSLYRNCLKSAPKAEMEAQILNNLAFACWKHEEMLKKNPELFESEASSILKDGQYVVNYLK